MALLEVRDLTVRFATDDGVVQAVDGVSYDVDAGRTLGIVGESGSGKSVSSLAVMGLTRFAPNATVSGSVRLDGQELLTASGDALRRLRGNDVAMVFQDPLSALHPFYRVDRQLTEAVRAHRSVSRAEAAARAVELLGQVGVPDPAARMRAYPHELSGGMRQRVMIAMALVNDPRLLIADEPTTALDVTVQAQILALLARLRAERGMAVVLVTHDLGVVAQVADEIAVMYAGRIVERAPRRTLFAAPQHPYTWGLLRAIPRLDAPREDALVPIAGRPPSLIDPPSGCRFHPRCPYARAACATVDPPLEPIGAGAAGDAVAAGRADTAGHADTDDHTVACVLPPPTRAALWSELRHGATAAQARERVAIPGEALS